MDPMVWIAYGVSRLIATAAMVTCVTWQRDRSRNGHRTGHRAVVGWLDEGGLTSIVPVVRFATLSIRRIDERQSIDATKYGADRTRNSRGMSHRSGGTMRQQALFAWQWATVYTFEVVTTVGTLLQDILYVLHYNGSANLQTYVHPPMLHGSHTHHHPFPPQVFQADAGQQSLQQAAHPALPSPVLLCPVWCCSVQYYIVYSLVPCPAHTPPPCVPNKNDDSGGGGSCGSARSSISSTEYIVIDNLQYVLSVW